jgi:DNA replicative helicase MCM subunit Mcm2 (Cdc46/Mcm family)
MATICPRCRGNGYIKVKESIENQMETIHQCPQCNSQGEIMMDEQRSKSIETQRLTLESVLVKELNGIIKKLNDEVDMLTKQKQFLQSKLREATGGKDQESSKQGD